jgi:hypothetical protein
LAAASRQQVLDRLVPVLAGALVVAAAAGSSSVPDVTRVGGKLRWVVLILLVAASALWARPRPVLRSAAVAAAAAFAALAVLSAAWSVAPRTSFERGVSLALLFAACALVAAAVQQRHERGRDVLLGLLGGATVVGLLGLLLLAVDHGRAIQAATYETPSRFQGLGQNPNTVGLLFAVATPLAVWALVGAEGTARRVGAVLVVLLFAGTIAASGSRGAIVAGALGSAVVLLSCVPRRRVLPALAAVVVAFVAAVGIEEIPSPSPSAVAPATSTAPAPPAAKSGYLDAEQSYPLAADVGQPLPGGGQPPVRRSLLGASGRLDAWSGALHQALLRPLAGHGFGTEQDVFVDRFYRFVGSLPENSYLGLALQLGLAGLAALAALVATIGAAGARALRGPARDVGAAGLGVLVAGLAIAVVQSYVYSVGNIATATLWLAAFVVVGVGARA